MAYEELASIRQIVDLTAQEALVRAETFLTQQGYTIMRRTDDSLTVERRLPDRAEGQYALNLTVSAAPQPGGGVRITVRGNDREGVQEGQAEWLEWSESLPKKPEEQPTQQGDRPRTIETLEVPLPPPPTVEIQDVSPPPQPSPSYPELAPSAGQGPSRRRWVVLGLGGCVVLPLLLVGFVGCLAVLGGVGGDGWTFGGNGSGETFTNENYADLVADPQGNRGASIDVTGKIFQPPEVRGDEAAFQIWVDPALH